MQPLNGDAALAHPNGRKAGSHEKITLLRVRDDKQIRVYARGLPVVADDRRELWLGGARVHLDVQRLARRVSQETAGLPSPARMLATTALGSPMKRTSTVSIRGAPRTQSR